MQWIKIDCALAKLVWLGTLSATNFSALMPRNLRVPDEWHSARQAVPRN
uniref:Uncharacterized protein n=1 Tax=Arundo donax TaxID=35708 RepID=A0A0A9A9T6_ARUDO